MTPSIPPKIYTLSMDIEFPIGVNPQHIERVIKNCVFEEGWGESFKSNYIHVENFKFDSRQSPSDHLDEWCKVHEEILKDIRTEAYRSGYHEGEVVGFNKALDALQNWVLERHERPLSISFGNVLLKLTDLHKSGDEL